MLRVSRRNLLASGAAVAAVAASTKSTEALLRRSDGASTITSISLVNTSASATNPGSVTQPIGCPFKRGDIAKGAWPQFQLANGTNVPCTILDRLATRWTDGSLKFVPVMLSVPETIAGNGSITVNILSGGQMPPPSPRNLKDFHDHIEPQVQIDGLDNLSGTWVMNLKHGIRARTKIVHYGNGAAGAVWKIRANAQQGGADHGQLVCDFYIASLANPDGSLKGLRILGKVKLPYYDTSAPMNWMSFSRFQLCLNRQGTLVRDCFGGNFGSGRAYTFSWAEGSTFAADHGYSTNCGGDYGYCTRVATTGTLPGGLVSNTSYFTGNPTTTTIGFATCASDPNNDLVSATSAGSGTQTATPYPYLAYFGALFTAGPTGMWDFVQGAGSDSADTPLRIQITPSYWVSTGLIPSYDITIVPTSCAPTSYWPNCSEPVVRYLETTGERDDLGILPSWYVRHFLTQATVDEQAIRVISLIGGHGFSIGLENSATLTIPCVNNGADGKAYNGMPAPNSTFVWAPNVNTTSGFPYGDTTDPMIRLAGFSAQDTTHMPQFNYYPYLFTGEPWHFDMLLEHANSAVYQRWNVYGVTDISQTSFALGGVNGGGNRTIQVGSNPARYGITIGCNLDSQRGDAWATGLLAAAAGICPENSPDCRAYKQYFSDMNRSTWEAATDILRALPPFAASYGLWCAPYAEGYYFIDHWQMAYLGAAVALAANVTEDRLALKTLNSHARYFDKVVSHFGGWHAGAYMTIVKTANMQGSPLITREDNIAFCGPNINWTAGEHFSVNSYFNYLPANGDTVIFADSTYGTSFVTPAGFKKYKPYYMINLNGNQFDLAAKRDGQPITLRDSYSGSDPFFIVSTEPPTTGSISTIGNPESYNTEILGMLNYASATGARVNAATLTDLSYRNLQAGNSFTSDPKWAMTTSFTQARHAKRRTFWSTAR